MMYYYRPGHPKASPGGFVSAEDLTEIPMEPPQALHAPIMVDRFYENTRATDGTDIGSRSKHREYMKRNGLTTADDFKSTWAKQAEQREQIRQGQMPSKSRREVLERRMYQIDKP